MIVSCAVLAAAVAAAYLVWWAQGPAPKQAAAAPANLAARQPMAAVVPMKPGPPAPARDAVEAAPAPKPPAAEAAAPEDAAPGGKAPTDPSRPDVLRDLLGKCPDYRMDSSAPSDPLASPLSAAILAPLPAVAPPQAPPPAAEPAAAEPDVSDLKVTAIAVGAKGSTAIINGAILGVGDTIGRAKVVAIGAQTVDVEIEGRRITLRR